VPWNKIVDISLRCLWGESENVLSAIV